VDRDHESQSKWPPRQRCPEVKWALQESGYKQISWRRKSLLTPLREYSSSSPLPHHVDSSTPGIFPSPTCPIGGRHPLLA
jgi:hypothetical protein